MILFLLDPIKQLNKAQDAGRKEDFKQIRAALDAYYNDTNCYPTAIPFGQEWKVQNTTYMKSVPQDPNCANGGYCYNYVYDTNNSCPQWNVLFGKLIVAPDKQSPACPLQDTCVPQNYSSLGYNLCDLGGTIDCDTLKNMKLLTPAKLPNTTPTPLPGTPTPVPTLPSSGIYYCACGAGHVTVCNINYNIPQGVQSYNDASCSNQCGAPC